MFFFLIAFEKVTSFGKWIEKIPVIGNFYMLFFILIGWVLFRAPEGKYALEYLLSLFGLSGNAMIANDTYWLMDEYWFTWVIGIICCFPIVKRININCYSGIKAISMWGYLAAIMALSIALINLSNYNPFIYFNF
jgi:hypothetical protein